MGGNALKNLKQPSRRCTREEFDSISNKLIGILNTSFKNVGIPRFYKNKQSFGDIDIIISNDNFVGNLRDYISEHFQPEEIFHNGSCWSFDYDGVQIDLITTNEKDYVSTLHYMSDNDLGNYIGKIAHGFGLKYGQNCLTYDHYFKGVKIGRVFISQDFPRVFEFLGLDYNRYLQGFDELEDIFKYISESKYFNWEFLQLENNNKVNRDRDKKRKSYMSFLEYIENNCKDDNHRYQYEKDKSIYFNKIIEFFPESNLEMEIRRMEYEYCKSLYIKAKFNGGEVMRRYGLEGKELGDAISGFKKNIMSVFGEKTYEDYIINNGLEKIYSDFEVYLKR
jgi:hypothetical protein